MTEISKSHFLPIKGLSMQAELQEKELERRLSLFQVFLKLYEQHRNVLDDFLQLENLAQTSSAVNKIYVQGVVEGSTVYIITNLCDQKTQALQQPQGIWTIGKDESNGISIADPYLSHRHAAIQYIDNQGFYLIDFNSANGSFINGEPVYQPTKLNDGDRIRLGMITFDFFVNQTRSTLPTVAVELLMQLVPARNENSLNLLNSSSYQKNYKIQSLNGTLQITKGSYLIDDLKYEQSHFTEEEKSEILDRFFSKHKSDIL
ncbi:MULTISPECIES: FHA domain-containing protein [Calothrix]|uniref:FHA domain-containing protein n=2 Tax=Calothrix TaxID=1186 RepID=A0ABR8AJT8_9CYAN|nr:MULTISPECIES: FHA domain-containing protein [Calothrix]MBD2200307.1 FHA domain-containing protein [Calothrix parietina FACHB-288]MBD2224304.1 FHA domain-containing protein [Calothrix anomala FACHB-343]